jgi:choline-sulfatase
VETDSRLVFGNHRVRVLRKMRQGDRIRAVTVFGLIACGLVWACGADPDKVEPGRDIVLIVIDTLRADHVGVYGSAPFPATPEIDRLALKGSWFTETWSSAPWTPPSIMSLMTSLEPSVHGLDLEGDQLAEYVPGFPPAGSSMAEVFRANGYRTMAVTAGGGVGEIYGFGRGFDRFYEPSDRPATDVEAGVDLALEWLHEASEIPTFLFFHTYEVHLPNTHEVFAGGQDPASKAIAAYASDLSVADHHLGRLFADLEDSGRLERSVVVVTSDHGENIFDRVLGERPVDHGHHLHAELLRVPLVVVAPGLVPASGAIEEPVRLLDVLPTVCSLVGISLDETPHQGRDLRPVLQGWGSVEPTPEIFSWAPLQGPTWSVVRTREWTYIESPMVASDQWWGDVVVPPTALFDRTADAAEFLNVARSHPEIVEAMASRVAERQGRNAALRSDLGEGEALSVDSADALRALGYLDRASDSNN